MEIIDVVDKNDNVIKQIDRAQAKNSDLLRVVGIMIFNGKKEILLQLRSKNKTYYPLHWDCSGGGSLGAGEDYLPAAKRELFEELGIKTKLIYLGRYYFQLDDLRKHYITYFKGRYDGQVKIDPKEVSMAKFFSIDEIQRMIKRGEKFHPECLFALKKYFL